jgi:transcription elongation factor GreA
MRAKKSIAKRFFMRYNRSNIENRNLIERGRIFQQALRSVIFYKESEMSGQSPITPAGLKRLEDELKDLKHVQRPAIIAAIADARGLGDLSENAEYHSAKEKQSFIEGRISYLENAISAAEVIDPAGLAGDTVMFGATVRVADVDTLDEKTYQIVGEMEADINRSLISVESPLARALMGKKAGEEAEFASPRGTRTFEVLSIEYK